MSCAWWWVGAAWENGVVQLSKGGHWEGGHASLGGMEAGRAPSFCHHHHLQLLLISCLTGEIGGRLQKPLGQSKAPQVLPTLALLGHGQELRLQDPDLTLIGWL